ncbi:uncharacterized protein LOC132721660 [Ruditapes philippinarum]|uniref:uncharacterized protein LOC132721660 n=1 Tax=Ruditapes philippinarum TaxID=129788 RepID=UPI00295A9C15|nr:uncharacterized protein LOC132721660 [Ruditapes philippinarum]
MDRLMLNRRQKTLGDKIDFIPAGDGLPVWSNLSLDSKLPMMSSPKGSVLLYTTKLGKPKHQCKQELDFDLRDPNGNYISNEYQPLHDPHLKTHFKSSMMHRHLIKKGFISEDGKVLCSLKEFNEYRRYLRHIYFLEIAKERKGELERRHKQNEHDRAELQKRASRGTLVRRRLHQQKERDTTKLKQYMERKSDSLQQRLSQVREEMAHKERKQREGAERRQITMLQNQRESEERKLSMLRRIQQRDLMKRKLDEDKETQRKMRTELTRMETWNTRIQAQKEMIDHYNEAMKQNEEERAKNISKRETMIAKKWEEIQKKIEHLKQTAKEKKQKKDESYFKNLSEKLASGDYRIWTRRKFQERRRSPKKTFHSSWKLTDVLRTFEVPKYTSQQGDPELLEMLNAAIDGAVDMVTSSDKLDEGHLKEKARNIVNDVIERVKTDIYPHYLQMLGDDTKDDIEAIKSKSVRFSADEEEIKASLESIHIDSSADSLTDGTFKLKPVSEHILTPCASQLELKKLEAEAILGSPELADKTGSISFVETLLLRLLDDLNSGRLSKEEIMKLASYSMDIIQSAETEKSDAIMEVPEESESDGPYLASSSSSIIAKKMIDFTLSKILTDIQRGNVHHDDLASLAVSLLDNVVESESSANVSVSEEDLDGYIEETIQRAATSDMDPREDSLVCETLLDDFMVVTLKSLIKDLEKEVLTKEQIQSLAMSVKQETKHILSSNSDANIENTEDVQNVLQDVLRHLLSGALDLKTMYQVVFAISYAYNAIKTHSSLSVKKMTDLVKEILYVVEQNAGNFEDLNLNIIHEANNRISNTDLNPRQVEDLSVNIVTAVTKSDICNVEMAKGIVEDVLQKTKEKLESNPFDTEIRQSVMDMAESVIYTLQDSSVSPAYVDVLLDLLKHLKILIENKGGINDMTGCDIDQLITKIASKAISDDNILEIATMIAKIVKWRIQSDSSIAASFVVKECLETALHGIMNDSVEDVFLCDMVNALKSFCNNSETLSRDPLPFLRSLATFLRSVLKVLTHRIQSGELNQADISELSDMFKSKIKNVEKQNEEFIDDKDLTQMIKFIQNFANAIQNGELGNEDVEEVGFKLIECGRKLVSSFKRKSDKICSPCSDTIAGDAVEEVIKTLQIEIEKGDLSKDSLKEMTKVIIESTSASDIASEVVAYTIKGKDEDIERGCRPSQLDSFQTIQRSPLASTVASQIVKQTIESIIMDITRKGIPRQMLSSVAVTMVTSLSGDRIGDINLQQYVKRFRATISDIVECLRRDEVSQTYAEEIFCIILEQYKTCVLHHKDESQTINQLSDDDVELFSNLVMETIQNVERSVEKGRMGERAFSDPFLPHSEDTSVMAEELIDACLDKIRTDIAAQKTMLIRPTRDLVDFILEIVTRLQAELADGTISNLSMAHFFQTISNEQADMKTLEMNAANNLQKVYEDIRRYRDSSSYVIRILDTYLNPDSADEVFGDPLKAIEGILVNVSSEILTKFVKATLQTILIGMRDDSSYLYEKAPSAYVLRSASSIIAENVIKEVVSRVNSDMKNRVHKIHGTVSKRDIERAASRIHYESPREAKKSTAALSASRASVNSVLSKELEDIVLETLHNIVSNLMLEQSMKSQKGSRSHSGSDMSQEIEDFVLSSLQSIVLDHQDRRSQLEMGVRRTGSKFTESSIELVSGESKEAMAYINEVLQNVIQEMKAELADEVTENGSNVDSPNIQTMILEYLQNAMNDSHDLTAIERSFELFSPDDVNKVLLETISGTVRNIEEDKFSTSNLTVMYNAATRFLKDADPQFQSVENEKITKDLIVDLMKQVKLKVETIEIRTKTLNRISSQLVTLGMDVTDMERSSPDNKASDLSIESSLISELVRDVLVRMSHQLSDELAEESRRKEQETANKEGGEHSKSFIEIVTNSLSKANSKTSSKKNVNYNSRMSASTEGSCSSDSNESSIQKITTNTKVEKGKSSKNAPTIQSKKPVRKSMESTPFIKQSRSPSKKETTSKKTPDKIVHATKSSPKKQIEISRSSKVVSSAKKSPLSSKKTSVKETAQKHPIRASTSEKKATVKKSLSPTISASTSTAKSSSIEIALLKGSTKNEGVKSTKDKHRVSNKISKPPADEKLVRPKELKSVSGVHKTKVKFREQIEESLTDPCTCDKEINQQ